MKIGHSSIVYKLTKLILGIIILQTLLISGILVIGGVLKQAENNAYRLFHDKVESRMDYVQREMKNNWTNFNPYLSNMTDLIKDGVPDDDAFFDAAIDDLIAMLRTTQATGAYIILIPDRLENNRDIGTPERLSALYIRDYDPVMNSYSDDDLYMVYGPPELAKKIRVPLDQTWRYNFEVTEDNKQFVYKPYEKASMTSRATLLGYWSKPFRLNEGDLDIITYSMPFFDKTGKLQGIIGIDLTLNYLADFLPASELQARDSLGYLIAYSKDDGKTLEPMIMGGPLQRRMIDSNQALMLEEVNSDMSLAKISNHLGKESLYVSYEKIGLYQYKSPFESEQWYLMGIMRGDYLLSYAFRIKKILWIALIIAGAIGAIGGILISYQVSKPIVALVNQVRTVDQSRELKLKPTGLQELDELSHAIETANSAMIESASRLSKTFELLDLPIGAYEVNHRIGRVFATDNFWEILGIENHLEMPETFLNTLKRVLGEAIPDEQGVHCIGENREQWIRHKALESEDAVVGTVMDITDEMLEKLEMKRERDHDPLTQLLNRKGFQSRFDKWRERKSKDTAALIMFDLDNLKGINDTYGHKWGDQYIVYAVDFLKSIDVEQRSLLARRSGDEFVLLMHGYNSREAILERLKAFYEKMKQNPIEFPGGQLKNLKISGGLMWITDDDFSYDELLHFADEALYKSKRSGKGKITVNSEFDEKTDSYAPL